MTDIFESTDSQRGSTPLEFLQTVRFDEPLKLKLGGELPMVTCAFETYGELDAEHSNAVLICHAISGDSHVASHHPNDAPGWWEELIGPGRAVDTDRYFVICPNILGSCRGTTGPGSINPQTGLPYAIDFPTITIEDTVDLQAKLIDHLGIDRLRSVIGGSMGGHQAMTWATRYPQRVASCCAIATSPRLSSQALAFDVIGRNAIKTDPNFRSGRYYEYPAQPDIGLAIARMLGHITYLSADGMDEKFDVDRHHPRDLDTQFEKKFSVGSYLAYQGHKFVERFDANSYITLSMAMDLVDFGATHDQQLTTFEPANCRWVIVGFTSDWLFPPSQSKQIVRTLNSLNRAVTYAEVPTNAGHDGFLIEEDIEQYAELVRATLSPPPPSPQDDPPPRIDDQRILQLIQPGESVLDLGCGGGNLLAALRSRGYQQICGVEIELELVAAAASRGLNVQHGDLNQGLQEFPDDAFDLVVLSATLQAVRNIEQLLDEMLRIGGRCIVNFANFAFRELRDMYARDGRSPKATGHYSYDWYNTPNRRFPSILDVLDLLQAKGADVSQAIYLDTQSGRQIGEDEDFNYLADTAILVFSR